MHILQSTEHSKGSICQSVLDDMHCRKLNRLSTLSQWAKPNLGAINIGVRLPHGKHIKMPRYRRTSRTQKLV